MSFPTRGLFAFCALLLGLLPRYTAADPPKPGDPLNTLVIHMADRAYAKALEVGAEILASKPTADDAGLTELLVARAHLELDQRDQATAVAKKLAAGGSRWATAGTYLQAEIAHRSGDPLAAAGIYRSMREKMAGDPARAEAAALYRELAEAATVDPDGPAGARVPDLARAEQLLEEAGRLEPDAGKRARDAVRRGTILHDAGLFPKAIECWSALVDLAGKDQELCACALYHRARAKLASGPPQKISKRSHDGDERPVTPGDFDGARADLVALLEADSPAGWAAKALLLLGQAHAQRGQPSQAVLHWNELLAKHGKTDEARTAAFELGAAQRAAGSGEQAIASWDAFRAAYAADANAPEAAYLAGLVALELGKYADAEARLDAYLRDNPTGARWQEARAAIERSVFDAARTGRLEGNQLDDEHVRKAALAEMEVALGRYLERYPAGKHSSTAHLALAAIAYKRGQRDAIETQSRILLARFAQSEEARRARLLVAHAAEQAGDLERTVTELEQLIAMANDSPEAAAARGRLEELRKIELDVVTPRQFSASEVASIEIASRNIPTLEVRVYPFDLAAHVRKHRSCEGIELVATEIVEPAATFTPKTAEYRRFMRTTLSLALDSLAGPGTWIVEVRTAHARAKALVVKSDLSLVARASPTGLVALAQRAGEPAAKVAIELMDDARTLAQAESGANGIATAKWDGAASQIAALAKVDGHVAFATWTIPGATETAIAPKGYVYTDRPLYRPGDTVHYRAILRDAVDGNMKVPANRHVVVTAYDARGLAMYQAETKVDAYGAIQGDISVGDEPALGTYRLTVALDMPTGEALSFDGSFWVEEYRKPPFAVELKTGDALRAPGDRVKVSLDARYRFGTQVADAKVVFYCLKQPYEFDLGRYRDFAWFFEAAAKVEQPTGEVIHSQESRTDAQGKAEIEYALPRDDGNHRYVVFARVTDAAGQSAEGATEVYGVLERHHAILRTDRKVYQPQEQVVLQLVTVDAMHTPVGLDGTLTVEERTGQDQYVRVHEAKATSDKQGPAAIKFALDKPGRYRARFEYTDPAGRFAPTRASCDVDVAGDPRSSELSLRLEKTIYRQGETAKAFLGTPAPGLSVLVTFEAEGILEHRVVRVAGRSTTLELPMTAALAPNAHLVATAIHDGKLYFDTDLVFVIEYLDVTVAPAAATAKPGEKIAIDITTRDQRGEPIAACVSCAVVDTGVLQLKADPAGPVKNRFYDRRRKLGVAGAGSTFRFVAKDLDPLTLLDSEREFERRAKLEEMAKVVAESALALRRDAPRDAAGAVPAESPAPPAPSSRPMAGKDGRSRSNDEDFKNAKGDEQPDHNESDREEKEKSGWAMDKAPSPRKGYLGGLSGSTAELEGLLTSLRHRRDFRDTAHWAHSVTTGKDGTARVTVDLPDNLTIWAVSVRGASRGNHLGDGKAAFQTAQPLLLEARAPDYLVEGDTCKGTLEVHNATDTAQSTQVGVRSGRDGEAPLPDRTLEIEPRSIGRTPIDLTARAAGAQLIEGSAIAGALGDKLEQPFAVLPAGTKVLRAGAGRLASSAERDVALPPYTDRASATLKIGIDPDPDNSLERALDELRDYPYGCFEQTVSRFLPAVAAIAAYQQMGRPNDRLKSRYLPIAHVGLGRLYDMQRADGGWGWWYEGDDRSPRSGQSGGDPTMTSYGLFALEICRRSGVVGVLPDRLARARNAARACIGRAGDIERGLLAWGLALGGDRSTTSHVSALHERREKLDDATLAFAALAAHELKMAAVANDLIGLVRTRAVRDGNGLKWGGTGRGLFGGTLEATSLAVLALTKIGGETDRDRVRAGADHLLASRHGAGWGTTKTSALAVLAIAHARTLLEAPLADYSVTVKVNGTEVGKIQVAKGKASGKLELVVPHALLAAENKIVFDKVGEGTLHFWYRLETYRRGKVTPDGLGLTVARTLYRGIDPIGAKSAPKPGHEILEPERRPHRPIEPVETAILGEVLRVELSLSVEEDADFVMVEDPLPAGVRAEALGLEGPHDRHEARRDRQVFFFTHLARGTYAIRYLVRAQFPGRFTMNPPRAECMYQPSRYAHGASGTLTVATGNEGGPAVEPTPDERWADAQARDAAGEVAKADALYVGLLALDGLRQPVAAAIARRLVALRAKSGGKALLGAYDELVRHDPQATLSSDELARVADAFADDRAGERANELYRVIFDRQLAVAARLGDALRGAGDAARAQEVEREWLGRLPPTPMHAERQFAWAAAYEQVKGEHGVPRLAAAIAELVRLEGRIPTSGVARLASRRVIELAERLGAFSLARAEAQRYLARHADEERKDELLLAVARNAFAEKAYDVADAAATELEGATIVEAGRRVPSPHRGFAAYLRGKVAHSRGAIEEAIAAYRKVADAYPDAADAVAFYERSVFELPAVVRAKPGQAVALPISHRNVGALELALYPIDLMTLFVIRGGQGALAGIDLSGIKPAKTLQRTLVSAKGFDLKDEKLDLGALAAGAYLVVGRAGGREVSCYVIASDLELRVQREGGRVYAHVTRGGKPVGDIQVRVAAGGRILGRGQTDARGVFAHACDEAGVAVVAFDEKGAYALTSE